MADPTTWKDVGIEFAKVLPASITASGVTAGVIYRWIVKIREDNEKARKKEEEERAADRARRDKKLHEIQAKQIQIEKKADGNHRIALKAIRAQGRLEGEHSAKRDARHDRKEQLDTAAKVLKVATTAKRRESRRTDK